MTRSNAPPTKKGKFGAKRRRLKYPKETLYYTPEWIELKNRWLVAHNFCVWCGTKEDLTVDHIIPFRQGGARVSEDNIQTLCRSCNSEKQHDDIRGYSIRVDSNGVPIDPRHPARKD